MDTILQDSNERELHAQGISNQSVQAIRRALRPPPNSANVFATSIDNKSVLIVFGSARHCYWPGDVGSVSVDLHFPEKGQTQLAIDLWFQSNPLPRPVRHRINTGTYHQAGTASSLFLKALRRRTILVRFEGDKEDFTRAVRLKLPDVWHAWWLARGINRERAER